MLKYLFISEHANGSIIEQSQDDVSPLVEGRSRFYDVLNATSPCVAFTLVGEGHRYSVNLLNGLFAVDGVSFALHGEEDLPISNAKLIFFRDHSHPVNVTGRVGSDGKSVEDVQVTPQEELPIVYRFGWEGTKIDGSKFERVIRID